METEIGDSKSKMEDYAAIEQIGRGALGAAFLVLHKTENKKYVLKKIRLSKQTEKFKSKACQEVILNTYAAAGCLGKNCVIIGSVFNFL